MEEGLSSAPSTSTPTAVPRLSIEIPESTLAELIELREGGNALAAWRQAAPYGPLPQWSGTRARVFAAWLANSLGAPQLARVINALGWRAARNDAETCAGRAHELLHIRGPLAAWEFLHRLPPTIAHRPEAEVYLLTVRALVSGSFRDHETAGQWLAKAEAVQADRPWLQVTRAYLLEQQDRYPEALAAAQTSLTLRPDYRAGFHAIAHCLRLLNRNAEAETVLIAGAASLGHASLLTELFSLQMELGKLEVAAATLEQCVAASPLMEPEVKDWVTAQRLLLASKRGDLEAARPLARGLKDPYHTEVSRRLEASSGPFRRCRLSVTFVRQHHATCAPATLAALSAFWAKPCEHTELAEAICYDGTPAYSERNWAVTNGWVAREFTVTRDSAVALLDRGLPFTLTTTEATSGHLQAVVGYDELRDTFLIRDPFRYSESEFIIGPFLERYRATGPRGMVLVPAEQAGRLEGLELPDAAVYDRFHELLGALERHDRGAAGRSLDTMETQFPDHRLTWSAVRSLAAYDANTPRLLHATERLLEQFPNDSGLHLGRLGTLRDLGRRAERLEMLERFTANPACEPVLFAQYAQELRPDAREHRRAETFCRRALRRQPMDAGNLAAWADLLWDQRRFGPALEYYRLAACLEDKKENFARSYFIAARHLRQTDQALGALRNRFDRFGDRSPWPAITLFESLEQLERTPEAFTVLEQARARRPNDGELILFTAEANARHARLDESARWLERARGVGRQAAWLRTAARLAESRNDRAAALNHWRELVQLEPTASDAHRQIALLLAETEGPPATLKHLAEITNRFPHNFALAQVQIDWLRRESAGEWERGARALLAINPADAWSHRELALALSQQGRRAEALAAVEEGAQLEPGNSVSFSVRGGVRRDAGDRAGALADFRHAIALSADNGVAIESLLQLLATLEEKRDALRFVETELRRQVIFGDGLVAFRELARGAFTAAEMREVLQAALDARPDLWQAWSAMINHFVETHDLETAKALAAEATERFPLLPRLWLDRARVCRSLADVTGESAALEQALAGNPDWSFAARQLAATAARTGDFDRALRTLERICARNPLEAENHAELAKVLWVARRQQDAIKELRTAIELNPGYEWFWGQLTDWAGQVREPDLPLQAARELVARRGGEARSWIILARMLHGREELNKVLATLDCALTREPRSNWAYDVRAEFLAFGGQKEAALKACRGEIWDGHPPLDLQARAAWVEAHFGQMDEAVALMKKLLTDHPDYYAGWKQLADWHWGAGREAEALAATDRMAELSPFDPIPLGYRAALKLRQGDRPGAKTDLQRALDLAPDYEYAANNLFDLLIEDQEFAAAERVLEVMRQHQNSDQAIASKLKLAAHRSKTTTGTQSIPESTSANRKRIGPPPVPAANSKWLTGPELKAAVDSFRTLCLSSGENGGPLEQAYETFQAGNAAVEIEAVLNEMIDHPEAHPQVGVLWVRLRAARRQWGLREQLLKLHARGEIGRRAIITSISCLGEADQRKSLSHLLDDHGEWLARDDWGWETATIALGSLKEWKRLIKWVGDWRPRLGAHPVALHNVLIALQARRKDDEAAELAKAAADRAITGRGYEPLLVWAALAHGVAGDVAAAQAALKKIKRDALDDYSHRIQRLARAVLALRTASLESRPAAWKEARRLVTKATQNISLWHSERAFRRAYWQSNRCLSVVGGRPWRLIYVALKLLPR